MAWRCQIKDFGASQLLGLTLYALLSPKQRQCNDFCCCVLDEVLGSAACRCVAEPRIRRGVGGALHAGAWQNHGRQSNWCNSRAQAGFFRDPGMGFPPELYLIILIMKLNLQGQTV